MLQDPTGPCARPECPARGLWPPNRPGVVLAGIYRERAQKRGFRTRTSSPRKTHFFVKHNVQAQIISCLRAFLPPHTHGQNRDARHTPKQAIHTFGGYPLFLLFTVLFLNKYVVVVGAVDMWTSNLSTSYPHIVENFRPQLFTRLLGSKRGQSLLVQTGYTRCSSIHSHVVRRAYR